MQANTEILEQIKSVAVLGRSSESGVEQVVSKQGELVDWIIDLRPLLLDPIFALKIARRFWSLYEQKYPFQIAAIELSGLPIASAIQFEGMLRGIKVNVFVVRKERKTSGRCRNYEGVINDESIVVVDDIFNSGASVARTITVFGSSKVLISSVFSIIDFDRADVLTTLPGVERKRLFNLADLGLERRDRTSHKHKSDILLRWVFVPEKPNYAINVPRSNPLTYDDKICFGSSDSCLYSLRVSDGDEIWHHKTPLRPKGIISSPSIYNESIYFGDYTGGLRALNKGTGSTVWVNNAADHIGSSPRLSPETGLLYVGLQFNLPRQRGALAAFRLEDGEQVWWHPLREWLHGSPVYIHEHQAVCVGTNDCSIICCDALTGEMRWRYQVGGEVRSDIAYDRKSGSLVFGCFDRSIYCICAATGQPKWRYETEGPIYASALISEEKVFLGSSDKSLYIIDLHEGRALQKVQTNSSIYGAAQLDNGIVWFGCNDGGLRGIGAESLKLERMIVVAERLLTKPTIVGNYLFIGGAGGCLFSFCI